MTLIRRRGRRAAACASCVLTLCLCGAGACDGGAGPEVARGLAGLVGGRSGATARLTGTVEIVWPGGRGAGAPDEPRVAQAELAAFAGIGAGSPGPGSFAYRVLAADGTLHREIGVTLSWVELQDQGAAPGELRFVGFVDADSKPCGGGGSHGDEGGGCSHDDEGGGCSHDDEGGGCSHDDEGGGCSHDDEGGTSHDDSCGGSGGAGGAGGPGGPGGAGGRVTGADCRIGQLVVGWAKDGGQPTVLHDRISWKWMAPDAPKALAILAAIDTEAAIPWPCKLCEKTILGGALKLQLPK